MDRFMVAFTWKHSPRFALAGAEHEQVKKLIADGAMEQMFLAHDRSRGWLVMLAESEEVAVANVASLPFYPSMALETTRLLRQYP